MTRSLPKIDITSHLPKLFAQTCVVLSGQGVHVSYVCPRHKGVFMKMMMMMMMGKWGKKKSGTTPCRTNTLARYSSSTCLGGDPLRTNRAEKNSRTKGKRAHFSPTAGVVFISISDFFTTAATTFLCAAIFTVSLPCLADYTPSFLRSCLSSALQTPLMSCVAHLQKRGSI